jgi:hypothetical protein
MIRALPFRPHSPGECDAAVSPGGFPRRECEAMSREWIAKSSLVPHRGRLASFPTGNGPGRTENALPSEGNALRGVGNAAPNGVSAPRRTCRGHHARGARSLRARLSLRRLQGADPLLSVSDGIAARNRRMQRQIRANRLAPRFRPEAL